MKKCVSATTAFFIILMISSLCSAKDAAMIVDIRGRAFYETEANRGRQLVLMDFLETGDKIRLTPDAVLILNYFASGIREKITGPGSIVIGTEESIREEGMKISSLKTNYLPPKAVLSRADVQQSGAAAFRSLGDPIKIVILAPTDTAVRSVQPLFQWRPKSWARSYHLRVYDEQDKLCFETKTGDSRFTYTKPALNRGEHYTWTVSAMTGERVATGKGEFTILDETRLEKVTLTEKKIKDAFPEDSAERLIKLALTYQHYKLHDEALDILKELNQRYPHNQNIMNWYRKTASRKKKASEKTEE